MAKKIMLLGSGELGKEFVIAAQRLGQTVVACDSYAGAPAMQVADACEVFDMLAAATADLFQGPNVVAIEKVFKKSRGLPENVEQHYFQEVIVNSDNLIHVFLRGKRQQQVVCFVCRKGANLGMVLTKARVAMPEVEAAL